MLGAVFALRPSGILPSNYATIEMSDLDRFRIIGATLLLYLI
jgi:hypothetical protein